MVTIGFATADDRYVARLQNNSTSIGQQINIDDDGNVQHYIGTFGNKKSGSTAFARIEYC